MKGILEQQQKNIDPTVWFIQRRFKNENLEKEAIEF